MWLGEQVLPEDEHLAIEERHLRSIDWATISRWSSATLPAPR
jgi:hypothetical protein